MAASVRKSPIKSREMAYPFAFLDVGKVFLSPNLVRFWLHRISLTGPIATMPKKYAKSEDFLKEIGPACVLLDVHLKTIKQKAFCC
jgi:hypothetical protein